MKRQTFLLALLLSGALSLSAQDLTGIVMDYLHEKAAEQIEKQLFSDSDSTETAEDDGWDEYFRTSDLEEEQGTQYGAAREEPDGIRIGCICMDGSRRDERGRGACSGRGGVRYWIYQVGENEVVNYPTERHWDHPEPLTAQERNNLSAYNTSPKVDQAPKHTSQGFSLGLHEVLITMMICATIAYMSKLWFGHE